MKLIEALAHLSIKPITVIGPDTLGKDVGKQYRWYGGKIQSKATPTSQWKDIATISVNTLCNGEVKDEDII